VLAFEDKQECETYAHILNQINKSHGTGGHHRWLPSSDTLPETTFLAEAQQWDSSVQGIEIMKKEEWGLI
jgi:hypothetical protein